MFLNYLPDNWLGGDSPAPTWLLACNLRGNVRIRPIRVIGCCRAASDVALRGLSHNLSKQTVSICLDAALGWAGRPGG